MRLHLRGRDLRGTQLAKITGTGADFSGVEARGASFGAACLLGAEFVGAKLEQTQFGKACLFRADFTDATVDVSRTLRTALLCGTTLPDGVVSNRDCGKGTGCCPACDETQRCEDDQVCCDGRCRDGDCCVTADCANRVCQTKQCAGFTCEYTLVSGASGPGCANPRICCENAQGGPVCCDAGIEECEVNGQCCAPITVCPSNACESIPDGCGGAIPCPACAGGLVCVGGICQPCTAANQCAGGQICCAGACQTGNCCPATGPAQTCTAQETCCPNGCRNLNNNPNNCGACGNNCPPGTPNCCNGTCRQCCNDNHCSGSTPFCNANGECGVCRTAIARRLTRARMRCVLTERAGPPTRKMARPARSSWVRGSAAMATAKSGTGSACRAPARTNVRYHHLAAETKPASTACAAPLR